MLENVVFSYSQGGGKEVIGEGYDKKFLIIKNCSAWQKLGIAANRFASSY